MEAGSLGILSVSLLTLRDEPRALGRLHSAEEGAPYRTHTWSAMSAPYCTRTWSAMSAPYAFEPRCGVLVVKGQERGLASVSQFLELFCK